MKLCVMDIIMGAVRKLIFNNSRQVFRVFLFFP